MGFLLYLYCGKFILDVNDGFVGVFLIVLRWTCSAYGPCCGTDFATPCVRRAGGLAAGPCPCS